jgi:hypothetical protein
MGHGSETRSLWSRNHGLVQETAMMCSIVCLQMRLPSRAGVFLYLARPAMNDSRRMEKGQDLSQTSMHVPGGFVADRPVSSCPSIPRLIHAHSHGDTQPRPRPRLHARRVRAADAWREARAQRRLRLGRRLGCKERADFNRSCLASTYSNTL